jgi:hypothetical protein
MNPGTIGAMAGGLVVCVAFPTLRAACPYRPPSEMSPQAIEGLREKYRRWDALATLVWLLGCIGLSIAWYLGLRQLAARSASDLGPSRYLILPSALFWAVSSLFLGLVSPWPLMVWLSRRALRGSFDEWLIWNNFQAGFDVCRLARWLGAAITVAMCALVVPALNCYAQFTEEAILIRRALEPTARRYRYEDIESIGVFRRFKLRGEPFPSYAIRFRDGMTWTTWEGFRDPDPVSDQGMMSFVSLASSKDILEIDSINQLGRRDRR